VAANTRDLHADGFRRDHLRLGDGRQDRLVSVPQQTAASLDDFSVVGGAWKVEDVTWHLTGFRQPGVETT
jgi:hypothetical protein